MRILHWYPNFLGGGGVANAVAGLALGQASLGVEIGIAAAKLSGRPLYEPMDDGGVTLLQWEPRYTLRAASVFARWLPRAAALDLQAFRPDLVHVHGEFNPDNLWVPRLFKCPTVLSPHGGFHTILSTESRGVAKRLYFLAATHLFYRHARAVHALSGFEQEDLTRLLPGAHVYCAPLGPNVRTQRAVPRAGGPRDQDEVRFLFVGRLDVHVKGLDLLLEAFARVAQRLRGRRRVGLTLVGPDWGGSRSWLERRREQLGTAGRIILTGPLSGEGVAHLLRHADIYVQLSRYESYGLSIMEALCAGKPTIFSAAAGLAGYSEVASLPHVRVVFPGVEQAADAMADFALRLGELEALAEQNRAALHAFCSWERVARLHLAAYQGILRAGVTGRPLSPRPRAERSAALPSVVPARRLPYPMHRSAGP